MERRQERRHQATAAAFAKVERAALLSTPDDLDHLLPAMLNDVFG